MATIQVGEGPFGLAVSPDDALVYVANNGDDTVSVIDAASQTVIATRPLAGRPRDVAFHPNGSRAYVTAREGLVATFDTATHEVVDRFELGGQPHGIRVSSDGAKAFVAQRERGVVAVLDMTGQHPSVLTEVSRFDPENG